jgi:hypothetical protein
MTRNIYLPQILKCQCPNICTIYSHYTRSFEKFCLEGLLEVIVELSHFLIGSSKSGMRVLEHAQVRALNNPRVYLIFLRPRPGIAAHRQREREREASDAERKRERETSVGQGGVARWERGKTGREGSRG